ncbi:MAG: thermonuclease family protein [Nitrosopumilus sp.]|nr:thermonuclease family protein [Nitrosopumilus sp.]
MDDKSFVTGIEFLIKEGIVNLTKNNTIKITKDDTRNDTQEDTKKNICSGNARCISGTITEIIDGDTIKVDGQSIRFSLASAPELDDGGGISAKNFIEEICPVGSTAIVDEDDEQTRGSYGRILGVIYCNDVNLNEELLVSGHGRISSAYCSFSEFSNHDWARKYGC